MNSNDWSERRRQDRAAAAEQARRDADAAAERRLHAEAVRAEIAERRRTERARARTQDRDGQRARAAARRAAAAAWVTRYRVELLIYPLAVVSAVMAVPAMAAYGIEVYGGPTGAVLPVLSELGMWAFALAVQTRRRTAPDAPVWGLQAGVWCFAAVAAGLNIAHGLTSGVSAALVMGVVSVAGVIAHQLVTAGPRRTHRSRAERAAGRKLAAARRAALDAAVAEVDADGDARLVIAPGTYRVQRAPITRRARLVPHTTPGLPVTDVAEGGVGAELAAEISTWLADQPSPRLSSLPVPPADDPAGGTGHQPDDEGQDNKAQDDEERPGGHGVATLDRSPGGHNRRRPKPNARRVHRAPRVRSLDQLRAELAAAVAAGEADPGSAESIRTALRCAPARARALRDEHRTTDQHTTDRTGDDQR